jgi:hypothetical protein
VKKSAPFNNLICNGFQSILAPKLAAPPEQYSNFKLSFKPLKVIQKNNPAIEKINEVLIRL